MKIIIDATWLGSMYESKVMHGGYRIILCFLEQLKYYPEHTFILTCTNHSTACLNNIKKFIKDQKLPKNVIASANTIYILKYKIVQKIYAKLNYFIPIPSIFPFISQRIINSSDVYYAHIDAIPRIIKKNKLISKFLTALDLIPLVHPEYSTQFIEYGTYLYNSIKKDTYIFAISINTKNDIIKYRPDINPNKIIISYLAADNNIFKPITNTNELENNLIKLNLNNTKYFLTINSLAKYKNIEFTIKYFIEFINQNNINDLFLVVVGQKRESNLSSEFEKLNNHKNIKYIEYVSEELLPSLYNKAGAFIYLSLYEGFGLPVLEAMQCGSPVICSNSSSLPEVAGNAAILVDPLSSVNYLDALNRIYYNSELKADLIERGIAQSSTFTWKKYSDILIESFHRSKFESLKNN